ncbi:MAG: hypothetical protein V1716_01850 [Candidatus Uhrbacteria bacterium]
MKTSVIILAALITGCSGYRFPTPSDTDTDAASDTSTTDTATDTGDLPPLSCEMMVFNPPSMDVDVAKWEKACLGDETTGLVVNATSNLINVDGERLTSIMLLDGECANVWGTWGLGESSLEPIPVQNPGLGDLECGGLIL